MNYELVLKKITSGYELVPDLEISRTIVPSNIKPLIPIVKACTESADPLPLTFEQLVVSLMKINDMDSLEEIVKLMFDCDRFSVSDSIIDYILNSLYSSMYDQLLGFIGKKLPFNQQKRIIDCAYNKHPSYKGIIVHVFTPKTCEYILNNYKDNILNYIPDDLLIEVLPQVSIDIETCKKIQSQLLGTKKGIFQEYIRIETPKAKSSCVMM